MTVLEILLQDKFVIAGTGSRSLDLPENEATRVYLFGKLVETLKAAKIKHDNLFVLSGGAEGWDRLLVFACIEAGVDYALVIPTSTYGEYYYRDHSVTGEDRYHVYCEMRDRAVTVECHPGKMMQFPNGKWGYQNMVRNQRMVDLSDIMWVWDPTSAGTKDCVARIRKANRRFYEFKLQGKLF